MKNIVERVVSRGLDIKVNDFLLFEIMNVCYSINEENLGNPQCYDGMFTNPVCWKKIFILRFLFIRHFIFLNKEFL